jgi:glycosyltransferase involved in cell wall biosynthesis
VTSASVPVSPYALDRRSVDPNALRRQRIFFDGVLKGDYSLAIVNRFLARALLAAGFDLTLYTAEMDWHSDPMLGEMSDVRKRCVAEYPAAGHYSIHLRNTWPPRADDMIGQVNAFVCFAWEEMEFAQGWVEHFNRHLDLVMVTSNFVERSFRHSGVAIPIYVVGDGCDHVAAFSTKPATAPLPRGEKQRFLHVSSCFPRKGADVLLRALLHAFRATDPVELVIKTFANPHNTILQDVNKVLAQDPRAPPVHVLTQSYPFSGLLSLVRTATALVAPSRGEGFGLPLAEAMMLGVPVITTGYGGQTDFCTSETAWLIEHRQVRSTAHVAGAYSIWAEPSSDSLAAQMRDLLARPQEARRRSENAKVLLRDHFKWSDVAKRVVKSLALAESSAKATNARAATIRSIDLVSTWDQVCGIATYAEHLCMTPALRPRLRRILAREFRADARPNRLAGTLLNITVERPWGHDHQSIVRLGAILATGDADVVWFQHHPGFFSGQDMRNLVRALKMSRYRLKAITLHNVLASLDGSEHDWLSAFDIVFVHTAADAEQLSLAGHQQLAVLPHGIVTVSETAAAAAANRFTIGTFGFLYPHKNLLGLVDAVARVREFIPHIRLKALTCVKEDSPSRLERARVEALVEMLGIEDAVSLRFDFLEDEEIIDELKQCDLLCFPYHQSSESATGAVRLALAADRPVLCSDSTVLSDVRAFSHVSTGVSRDALAEAIIVLACHGDLRGLHDEERRKFVRDHNYKQIATRVVGNFEYFAERKMQRSTDVGV